MSMLVGRSENSGNCRRKSQISGVSWTATSTLMWPSTMFTIRSATSRMRLSCVTMMIVHPSSRASLLEQRHHLAARVLVERRRRLVGEHQLRLMDQPAGDGDALLLPAGERLGLVVDAVPQAEPREQVARSGRGRRPSVMPASSAAMLTF